MKPTQTLSASDVTPCSALWHFHRKWYGRKGFVKSGILTAGKSVVCTGVCDDGMAREGMGYTGALPTGQVFLRVEGMTADQCELPRNIDWEPNDPALAPPTLDSALPRAVPGGWPAATCSAS